MALPPKKTWTFIAAGLLFGFMLGILFANGKTQTPTANAVAINLTSPGIGLYASLLIIIVFILVILFAIKIINHPEQ
ncbi:hypothetical protein HZB01_02170 [Candidatus Woesearchaeota archaeon]|nr:hypothetical protein [Candidatus Woesearchaeota archaeon]